MGNGIPGLRKVPVALIPMNTLKYLINSHPLSFYNKKGRTCVYCGIVGELLVKCLEYDGNYCLALFTKDMVAMTIDHFQPLSKGGHNSMANKWPCCTTCNYKKGNKIWPITTLKYVKKQIKWKN